MEIEKASAISRGFFYRTHKSLKRDWGRPFSR